MVSVETLLDKLPVRNQLVLTEDRQNTDDIRKEILIAHREFAPDYDLISHYFDTGNVIDTSRQIFEFIKQNVPYRKEAGNYQTIKSPALILSANNGKTVYDRVDCKNYASFIAGILDSIKRNNGGYWDWCFRFASYEESDPEPGHVFVVVKLDGKELWIDPVFAYFNGGMLPEWELDQKPKKAIAGLYRISGPENNNTEKVIVNTRDAARNFLVCVNMNLFALADLLLSYPAITNSAQFQQTLIDCGVSLNALREILIYRQSQ